MFDSLESARNKFSGLTVNVFRQHIFDIDIIINYYFTQGNVRFNENGTRIYPNVRVLQYQRKGKIEIL